MRILAADTSTLYCSVALCQAGDDVPRVLCETTVSAGRRHSEILLSQTRGLLDAAQLSLNEIDLLAISAGPGSFTGLRVGMATWKGLAFGLRKPLMAVPTLDAMARRIAPSEAIACPMLDARMDEVFAAVYRLRGGFRECLLEPIVAPAWEVIAKIPAGAVVFGDGALRYRNVLENAVARLQIPVPEFHVASAASVAFEAAERLGRGESADASAARPIYLRRPQAEVVREAARAAAP